VAAVVIVAVAEVVVIVAVAEVVIVAVAEVVTCSGSRQQQWRQQAAAVRAVVAARV
jgi:hypothetical protein